MSDVLLEVEQLGVSYGGIQAVKRISFSIHKGELLTLIGANGAGKSSTVRALTGLQPYTGTIRYNGLLVNKQSPETLLSQGLVMVPEGRGIFQHMSVLENLQMGAWLRRDKRQVNQEIHDLFERFPRLGERQNQLGGLLSGGEQQLLALARALLSRPKLLILDEPSMGLAPLMVENIFNVISSLRSSGITLLLIEQNARLALDATDRGLVMDCGEITLSGASSALLNDNIIQTIYLGE
jgi:branched-chain amino acid transport system ATP-binding protein